MLQGGGMDEDGVMKTPDRDAIKHGGSSLRNIVGTLSMARGPGPDSAGSQFFICVDATPQLDGQYTIFGHVVMGMEVADTIVSAPKDPARGRDAPAEPVKIRAMTVVSDGLAGLSGLELKAFEEMKTLN